VGDSPAAFTGVKDLRGKSRKRRTSKKKSDLRALEEDLEGGINPKRTGRDQVRGAQPPNREGDPPWGKAELSRRGTSSLERSERPKEEGLTIDDANLPTASFLRKRRDEKAISPCTSWGLGKTRIAAEVIGSVAQTAAKKKLRLSRKKIR